MAGDYMYAASFLGISAQIFTDGYDGLIYSTGFLVGWPILLFLMAERLRNLGRFTFADVAGHVQRLGPVQRRGADRLDRGHAPLDHLRELPRIVAVRIDARVGTEDHPPPPLPPALEHLARAATHTPF